MNFFKNLSFRSRALLQKRKLDAEMDEEMRSHIEMRTQQNIEAGMPPEEARFAAQRQFGYSESIKETCRDQRGVRWMDNLFQDLRYGARQLRKNRGFTAVAVLTLALGIGANTAIFSMVNGVLLRRPPIPHPDRVVVVSATEPSKGSDQHPVAALDFVAWREQNHSFETMVASQWSGFTLTGKGEPESLDALRVSPGYFQALGVSSAVGRTFLSGEDQAGKDHVLILSHELWQGRFGADPNVIGKTVKLNGESYVVVGVMPARFKLISFNAPVWIPLTLGSDRLSPAMREDRSLNVTARLKTGASVASAQAEMSALAQRLDQSYPGTIQGWGTKVIPLQKYMIDDSHVKAALVFLMGASIFVLLIACANIANLLLARATVRQREFAVRAAIGASRFRLIRQLLAESLLLALAGGVLGLLLADWGLHALRAALNWNEYVRTMAAESRVDLTVLLFTLAASVLTVLLFGLAPAIRGTITNLNLTLQEGGRTASGGRNRGRTRDVLVAGEIALALVLLVGAGLFVEQFVRSLYANFGIDPSGVLTAKISLPRTVYGDPSKQAAFFQKVIESLEIFPGVVSAGATTILPPNQQGQIIRLDLRERPTSIPEDRPQARFFAINHDYFQTLRVPLIQGRYFSSLENAKASAVVLVNAEFVKRFFPETSPLGKYIKWETGRTNHVEWSEIVGVVGNVKDWFGEPHDLPQVYAPSLQSPSSEMVVVARTSLNPASLVPLMHRAVWEVDKDQPVTEVRTIARVIDDAGAGDRLMSVLMGIFAILALVLATVGIFGLMAYMVAQRTHEIGVRMAIGAQKGDVLRLIMSKGILLAASGTAIGFVLAFPIPQLMNAAFVGFIAHVGPVFFCVFLLIAIITLAATYIPARRATKVDPIVALRYE